MTTSNPDVQDSGFSFNSCDEAGKSNVSSPGAKILLQSKTIDICGEPHCKNIAYNVTGTIPLDYKLTHTKLERILLSFPSCKSTNFTFVLCNQ